MSVKDIDINKIYNKNISQSTGSSAINVKAGTNK
jgi:hypothetical protein